MKVAAPEAALDRLVGVMDDAAIRARAS